MHVVVVGGGPGGATTAHELALRGVPVTLLERAPANDKPCAGGMPEKLLSDFDIPSEIVESINHQVYFVSPSKELTYIDGQRGHGIAVVKRCVFDRFLRERAAATGVDLIEGEFVRYEDRGAEATPRYKVHFRTPGGAERVRAADFLIGADGAISRVAKQALGRNLTQVVARQKFMTPTAEGFEHYRDRIDVYYTSEISPDYYGWVFPRKSDISIGVGLGYNQGRLIRPCLENLIRWNSPWLEGAQITQINAAPIPVEQNYAQSAIDNILLVGDSAGFVLPALGEGIYYAMLAGRLAAEDIHAYAEAGAPHPRLLYPQQVEEAFEPLFRTFRLVQNWAYVSDFRRELFCRMCDDPYYGNKLLDAFAMKKSQRNRNLLQRARNYTRLGYILLKLRLKRQLLNTEYLRREGIDFRKEFAAAAGR